VIITICSVTFTMKRMILPFCLWPWIALIESLSSRCLAAAAAEHLSSKKDRVFLHL